MTKRLITLSALALALLLATSSSTSHADESGKAEAQKLLSEGNKLLAGGDNGGALAKFEAAYSAYPSPSLLLNIGTTLRALGRNAEAANAYARWVKAKQSPERLAEVEEALSDLDSKVGGVTVVPSEAGASIAIDGKGVSSELLKDVIRLEPGSHTIVATKTGFGDASKSVTVTAGEKQTVELTLEKVGGTTGPSTDGGGPDGDDDDDITTRPDIDEGPDPSAGRGLRIAGLSLAGVGLLSVAAAVKFGLDAKSINSDLEDNSGAWTDELLKKQSEGDSAETKFIVFSAVGGVAIAAGATLYILGRSAGQSSEERSLAIAPVVTADTVGWAVAGSF